MDWDKLGERMKKRQAEEEAELERLAVDPGPPLEAKPVDGMHDWTQSIGVLYGTPTKVGDDWGVRIYPTRQQEALIDVRRQEYYDRTEQYDDGYLKGLDAVSIDKNGRVRTLTIAEPRGFVYDMDGNINCTCETTARLARNVEQPRSMPAFGADHVNPAPPSAPSPARDYAAAQDLQRGDPSRGM